MKKLFLFLVFISTFKLGFGQTFAPEGSYWHYCHMGLAWQFNHYDSLSYRGDTVVDALTLKKIGPYLFYVNGDTTYRVMNTEKYVLYNFSLEVGDTLRFWEGKTIQVEHYFLNQQQPNGYVTFQVITKGNMLLGNDSVRHYTMQGIHGSYQGGIGSEYASLQMEVIEKIGLFNTPGKLIPYYLCGTCDTHSPMLTRFDSTSAPSIYQNSWFNGCGYLSVKDEVLWESQIYPNPASDMINIGNPYPNYLYATFSDIHGKVVKSNILLSAGVTASVPVSEFASGIYILSLQWPDGKIYKHKIIKQ